MNKVWVLAPNENWIIDRFVSEWNSDNADIVVSNPYDANVIWLLADFAWTHVPMNLLRQKKVITSIHHIVPEKFNKHAQLEFQTRDSITDVYHVYNERTYKFISKLTTKPIKLIHYWANQKIWFDIPDAKSKLRDQYHIPKESYVIFSAQRDTEGHDLVSPKLEKGPDLFVEYVIELSKIRSDICVLLAGWRRQYVISKLNDKCKLVYHERPEQPSINDLYNISDLYVVSSRCEGGPQALIECGLTQTPCISTPIGIAEQVLPNESINSNLLNAIPNIPDVKTWELPAGYEPFRKLIQSL